MGNCFTKYQIIFHSYDTALSLPDDWVIMLKCYISSWLWQWRSNQIFFLLFTFYWMTLNFTLNQNNFFGNFYENILLFWVSNIFFKLATELLCRQWLSASKNNTLRSLDVMSTWGCCWNQKGCNWIHLSMEFYSEVNQVIYTLCANSALYCLS